MPRVLHIFGRLNRGGAELRTLDILRQLEDKHIELEFVSLSGQPGDLDDEIRSLGSRVHYCRLDPGFPWRFPKLLRNRRIDVVHSHVQLASGFILRLAGLVGVPVRIAHFRSCGSGKPTNIRRWLQEQLMRHLLNRWATLFLGNSEASLANGWRHDWSPGNRCAVIHNGLDVSELKQQKTDPTVADEFGWDRKSRIAIHVGRMDPAKNHERLLEIWAEMAAEDSSCRFLSAGRINDKMYSSLQAKAARLGLSNKIVWAGQRTDIPRLLFAADVMIFPSLLEGLPGAVLEANAAGVPVIGSDIPAIREICQHLKNVSCLSLNASNTSWAQAANTPRPTAEGRRQALKAYEAGVYTIAQCVRAHQIAWCGGTATDVAGAATGPLDQLMARSA